MGSKVFWKWFNLAHPGCGSGAFSFGLGFLWSMKRLNDAHTHKWYTQISDCLGIVWGASMDCAHFAPGKF